MKFCLNERQKLTLMGAAMVVLVFVGYGASSYVNPPAFASKSVFMNDDNQVDAPARTASITPQGGISRSGRKFVSLNRASRQDFEGLPGVSPKVAQRMIEHRISCGGFRSIEDVQYIPGVGPRRFEAMRPFLKLEDE